MKNSADYSLINYDNCITNLTSSIQKYYGIKPNYKTNELADGLLAKKDYDNVLIILFDAMGVNIINKHLSDESFIKKHLVGQMNSCYPPTTANCTTAYVSGKNPIVTGWLGWSSYFKDINLCVDNFTNNISGTKNKIEGENIAHKFLPFVELGNEIEETTNGKVKYYVVGPSFYKNGCKTMKQFQNTIIDLMNRPGKKYFYCYWDEPDHSMHEEGIETKHISRILKSIDRLLKNIERKTNNSIAFISADHGMINVKEIAFYTYVDIFSLLKCYPTCDSRTPFFFVKDGKKEEFKNLFEKYFSDDYDLLTKDEVIEKHIFGYGKENERFSDLIGDFVGFAKSDHYFSFSPDGFKFAGHHAGLTKDEMTIPIIVLEN